MNELSNTVRQRMRWTYSAMHKRYGAKWLECEGSWREFGGNKDDPRFTPQALQWAQVLDNLTDMELIYMLQNLDAVPDGRAVGLPPDPVSFMEIARRISREQQQVELDNSAVQQLQQQFKVA